MIYERDGKKYKRTFVIIQNDDDLVQIIGITKSDMKAVGIIYDFAQKMIDDYDGYDASEISPMQDLNDDDTITVTVKYAPHRTTRLQMLWEDKEIG